MGCTEVHLADGLLGTFHQENLTLVHKS
jgi:hypothetical protein